MAASVWLLQQLPPHNSLPSRSSGHPFPFSACPPPPPPRVLLYSKAAGTSANNNLLLLRCISSSSSSSSSAAALVSTTKEQEEVTDDASSSSSSSLPAASYNYKDDPNFRGCKGCGRGELQPGCNGEGRIQGGIAAVPGFGWWPIKAYRPCPGFLASGGRYRRQGQSMDDVASGKGRGRGSPKTKTNKSAK
ncbi:hypothetical protein BS78_03G004000 [Paspalum vaginatum]|nr:hypothetical protein BS78_03G004000 [Paspalum vaginatum]